MYIFINIFFYGEYGSGLKQGKNCLNFFDAIKMPQSSSLQEQEWCPISLWQIWDASQAWVPKAHSSISWQVLLTGSKSKPLKNNLYYLGKYYQENNEDQPWWLTNHKRKYIHQKGCSRQLGRIKWYFFATQIRTHWYPRMEKKK